MIRALATSMCWLLSMTLAAACAPEPVVDDQPPVVRIASGPDDETRILAHVVAALVAQGEFRAQVVPFSDSRDARQALELGEVDIGIGYTGEVWLEVLGRPDPPSDPRAGWLAVSEHDAERGLVWMRPRFGNGIDEPPANATFAFVVQGPPSIDADLVTMSQLAARLSARPDALVCVDREFADRPDGLAAVLLAYSVRSDRPFLAADPAEAVLGVAAGECIAGLTTATDGAAWRSGLYPLADDLRVFPAFVPLPVITSQLADEHPGVAGLLRPLSQHLTTSRLGAMNARLRAGAPIGTVADEAAASLTDAAVLSDEPD
ncbi:MAG: glycine betaine ABC transporter substrate-binding protein [Nitriliruptoraceae bacterium]